MNTQELEYFVAVAETLNFNKAAERLYVSQPALSYRISALEKELDTKLFFRDKKRVYLTEAGKVLYKEAVVILEHMKSAYEKVKKIDEQNTTLVIGFLDLLLGICFKELSGFMTRHMDLKVIWEKEYMFELMEGISNGRYNVVIARSDALKRAHISGLKYKTLHRDEFVLAVPSAHKLAQLKEINDISLLSEETFIILDSKISGPLHRRTVEICSGNDFTFEKTVLASHMDVLIAKVTAGLGIAIIPYFCGFYSDIEGLHFVKIRGVDTESDIVAVWNPRHMTGPLKTFIKYLDEQYPNRE